jgi:tetratricopeptide (TPR) repeat protein
MTTARGSTEVRLAQLVQGATAAFSRADWAEAERLARAVLTLKADEFVALSMLGIIALRTQHTKEAEALFRRAVAARPGDPSAYNNHGNALKELARLDEALKSYDRALQIHPGFAEAHSNRAIVLQTLGRVREALDGYDRALKSKPGFAQAHGNRGAVLHALGRHDEALESYERALQIDGRLVEVHNNRGNALKDRLRLDEAQESYDRALQLDPRHVEAHSNRGIVLQSLGRLQEALESYDRALKIKPDFAEAHGNRGVVLQKLGRLDEALASFDRALQIRPGSAVVHVNRGNTLKDLMRLGEALESYDRALLIHPELAEAHSNRGNALKDLMRLDEAVKSYDRALRISPGMAEFHTNRGNALKDLGRLDEAQESYERALQINPELAEAHFNLSLCRLLSGDFVRGWKAYEWRWRTEHMQRRNFAHALWLGNEFLAGKTILLHAEQGLGDTLQFCRYATLVGELGARVILEVPKPLVPLSSSITGVAQTIAMGDALPAFDYHCPLMSLPLAFGTTVDSIPSDIPYIRADHDKVAYWRSKLGTRTRKRVGLVWSGGFRKNQPHLGHVNQRRNIPLADICSLKSAQVNFYSLQKGEPAETELREQQHLLWPEDNLFNFASELQDFSDTAALIDNLDLIISVDTSTAHLAGAMGKPVWLLNRFDTCWRWFSDRTDSPWYPGMKVFRQPAPGDWRSVLERVREELTRG